MASWRDNLLPGAIAGVPFDYEEVTTEFGRRVEVHEFPLRADPFTEDLGKAARRYTIRAFVIGENYATVRNDLIDVLEAPGPHVFTHPYLGDFLVKVNGHVRLRESDREGRMAVFEIPLVEAGIEFPSIALDTPAKVGSLSLLSLGKLSVRKFDLLGAIASVLNKIANAIGAAASKMRQINGKIGAALNLVDNITAAIDDLNNQIGTLLSAPQALLNKLVNLAASIVGLIKTFVPPTASADVQIALPDLPGLTSATLNAFITFDPGPPSVPTNTPQSNAERAGLQVIKSTMQAAGTFACADAFAAIPFESATQATDAIGALDEAFDVVLGSDDLGTEIVEAATALKAAVVEHLTKTVADLPSLAQYVPPATVPALVLANRLYGDATRENEIIRRNRIRHPAFVIGGRPLEVIAS